MLMEVNLKFVSFEDLQEKADGGEAVTCMVIVRECKNPDFAFEEGAAGFYPLE
jgi:hypothetical protein